MTSRHYVKFGEVEESRVCRYRIDTVMELDQNVGRAELITAILIKAPAQSTTNAVVTQLFVYDIPRLDGGERRTRHRDPQPST
jgi:hypothetical protein